MIAQHRTAVPWPGGEGPGGDGPLGLWAFDLGSEHGFHDSSPGLSGAERARAARIFDPELRARYVLSRRYLRAALGHDCGRDPSELVFAEAAGGKPRLACGALQFNLAHSGDWLLIATHPTAALGVDIECIAPRAGLDRLIARVLTPREATWLAGSQETDRLTRFLSLWTRKEALVKWSGEGLARDPAQICTQPPWFNGPCGLVRIAGRPVWVRGVTIGSDTAGRGYVGAIAIG